MITMHMHMRLGVILGLLVSTSLAGTDALNILSITTVATTSHFLWTNTLVTELLSRGHSITELTFKQPEPHPNRTSFVLESGLWSDNLELFGELINSAERDEHFLTSIFPFFKFNVQGVTSNMASQAFQDLRAHLESTATATGTGASPSIDLVLIDNAHRDGLVGLSQLVGHPPIVTMTAFNHPLALNIHTGTPPLPALVPHEASPFSCEMTFPQRVVNFLAHAWFRLVEVAYYEPAMDALFREVLSAASPSLGELELNISMALVNTHSTTHCEQPSTASVVQVGFLHVKPPKPLPKDIQKFVDEADDDDGVVVFSFGSMIRPDTVPGLQDTLVEVFRKFKQRIVWRTPNPPKTLPPNVFTSKWLPQSDVLAHPKVRLVVTHGGTLSMQEAVYRGVPILVIPFFLDQEGNGNRMVSRGVGRILKYSQLTVQTLTTEMKAILENVKYRENMKRLSTIAQDQLQSPLQRAVFAVEFVGRHKGAPFLNNSNRQYSWIQYYSLDVITFLAFVLLVTAMISVLCLRRIFRLFTCTGKAKVE